MRLGSDRLKGLSEKTILVVSEYAELYFSHPAKAHIFLMKHEKEIDDALKWYQSTKKDWEREQLVKNWMELINQ